MSVIVTPETPETYDEENKIKWSEIAPSLQERFLAIGRMIDSNMQQMDDLINNIRLTISYDPPLHPEPNRDVWWDLNYHVLRFYMDKTPEDSSNEYKWEFTRGAWYGGSSSDIKAEVVPEPQIEYAKMKPLCWISNVASNNQYTTENEFERSVYYTAPVGGTYKIEDMCNLFEYNAQKKYTHDGGRMTVAVNKQTKSSSYSSTQIYSAIYDSKTTFTSKDENGFLPSKEVSLAQGDRILMSVTTERNPQSTDSVEIYQIACINVYRKVK